jgi:Surfeit locus protein 6/60S ribosome biogenesis protein Rrp14
LPVRFGLRHIYWRIIDSHSQAIEISRRSDGEKIGGDGDDTPDCLLQIFSHRSVSTVVVKERPSRSKIIIIMPSSSSSNNDDAKKAESALLHSLEQELLEHNEFFDMLVDMIPSKLYVAGTSGDDFNPKKYLKGSNADSKQARRAAAKEAKRRKLDPSLAESTVAIKTRIDNSPADNESDDEDEEEEDEEMEEEEEEAAGGPVVVSFPPAIPTPYSNRSSTPGTTPHQPGLSRIEVLKQRLHAKIKQQQGGRPSEEDGNSKRAARRAEKVRRRDELQGQQKRGPDGKSAVDRAHTAGSSYKVKNEADLGSSSSSVDPAKDLKRLDFGRLAGFDAESKNYLETNKALGGLAKNNKNLQKMLTEAEEKKQKLEKLKDGTTEEKERANAILWKDALKEADGVRVRDDTTTIKKALKRKAASKAKSQKSWQSRLDQQQDQAKNRQNIREHNLKQRRKGGADGANLSKKRMVDKSAEKSGRLSRAGFEGKKQEFLNSSKKD